MLWVCKDPEAGQRAERGALQRRPRDRVAPGGQGVQTPRALVEIGCVIARAVGGHCRSLGRRMTDLTYNVL